MRTKLTVGSTLWALTTIAFFGCRAEVDPSEAESANQSAALGFVVPAAPAPACPAGTTEQNAPVTCGYYFGDYSAPKVTGIVKASCNANPPEGPAGFWCTVSCDATSAGEALCDGFTAGSGSYNDQHAAYVSGCAASKPIKFKKHEFVAFADTTQRCTTDAQALTACQALLKAGTLQNSICGEPGFDLAPDPSYDTTGRCCVPNGETVKFKTAVEDSTQVNDVLAAP